MVLPCSNTLWANASTGKLLNSTGATAMRSMITLSAISLLALAASGCGNQLDKPNLGQTPSSINANTPAAGTAGGPLVPATDPNAGSTLAPTQPGGGGAPLTAPESNVR